MKLAVDHDLSASPSRAVVGRGLRRVLRSVRPRTPTGAAGRGAVVLGAAAGLAAVAFAGATAGPGSGGASGARAAGSHTAPAARAVAPGRVAVGSEGQRGHPWPSGSSLGPVRGSGRQASGQPSAPSPSSTPPSSPGDLGHGAASSDAAAADGGATGNVGAGAASSAGAPGSAGVVTAGTVSPAPVAGGSCGGQPTVVSDGITWTCTFDSEFTGTTLDRTKWQPITTAVSGYLSGPNACYVDNPANISVGNGYLSLTALRTPQPFTCTEPWGSFTTQYTSASLSTFQRFDQTYGRFEVVAKVPATAVPGLQSSFWLFPESLTGYGAWPASGEIDIAEIYSQYSDLGIPFLHYNTNGVTDAATGTNVVTNDTCRIAVGQFNDYVLEWTPSTMRIVYNGSTCLVDHWQPASPEAAPEPFDQPFFVNLTQALGMGTNQFDPSTTPLPATTEVKAVRVWQAARG